LDDDFFFLLKVEDNLKAGKTRDKFVNKKTSILHVHLCLCQTKNLKEKMIRRPKKTLLKFVVSV